MKSVAASTLFLLLFNLRLEAARGDIVSDFGDVFGRKDLYSLSRDGSSSKEDETMIRRIEEEMSSLNKSRDGFRDKRALGILLQGFMEALGYTVSPIQLASLPNPAPMPGGGAAAAMPAIPAAGRNPAATGMMNASASAPPRQRETLRFTGLLNFGNSENTTHLIDHLARYEQMFHGNRSAAPAAPAPAAAAASGPDIDPRSRPPLNEPLFVQIPLPIVPNLPPPQPPSPMPLDHSYHQEVFSKESSEEYSGSKDDEGQRGHSDEEDEDSQDSDDYEYKHDKYDSNPEDRNYDNKETDESYEPQPPKPQEKSEEKEQPRPKEKHREYKSNKNVENFTVENKEIHDPSEVDEEGPKGGSQFDHATFVDEPNWKAEQDAKIHKIAAEQEARAEALAEENAEREKEKEEEEKFHRNREKEIDEANEERDSSYQKKPHYDDDDEEEEDEEGSSEKESYDEDEEKEGDHEERGTHRNEARAQVPINVAEQVKNYQDADFYPATLPISYDRVKPKKDPTLRDSYGASLEKPGGKVDERVAEYITMFKNPRTGVYDPKRVRDYEHARISFDHGDLIDGFNRIQKEYGGGAPENKYEEYEIDAGERVEHRSNGESKEILATQGPKRGCSCNKKNKIDLEVQGARSTERPVTQPPPPPVRTSTGYGPYYSTMKYLYDPLEHDHGIIARLTSYEKPTTVKFEDFAEQNRGPSTIVQPTIPPERLTTLSFLHEAENEEFRAWPAPFDFLYDNSERKNVVYKKSPPPVAMPAPFTSTRPTCNHHMTPFREHRDKANLQPLRLDHAGERYKSERDSKKRPSGSHENRKAKPSEQINKRVEYFPNHSTTQPTVHDQRKRPPSNANYRASIKPTLRSLSLADIITTRPERVRSTKNPRKNRKIPKQFDQTARPAAVTSRESTTKPTVKVKYTYQRGKNQGNVKEETANYYEKNGMLVIPEPTPYHYNEEFGEFTEEPLTNTERIQIKEYRNHVASVEVAELKQLHPEGPMHLFKYTRNL